MMRIGVTGSPEGSNGFTLVELLAGLAILSLMALVTLPAARSAYRARALDSAALDLASVARMTRASAVRTGVDRELVVDPDSGSYWSLGVAGKQHVSSALRISLEAAPGEMAMGGAQSIRFMAGGGATGGQVVLRDGSRVARVRIDWLTGAAHVSR